jgi:carbohydrate-selective porin OprB
MTRTFFLYACLLCVISFSRCYADKVIWSGDVSSNGLPTAPIELKLHKKYQIKVNGFVNLGKWRQNGEALASDACFEFNKENSTEKLISLKNSLDISVCDGTYHPSHQYESLPFIAQQNRIFFWVSDTNYEDNSGAYKVEITEFLP